MASESPRPDRVATIARAAGFILVGVAIAAAVLAFRQGDPGGLGFGRTELADRWNAAADSLDRPELRIGAMEWTDREAGVFGYAFTPTLSVLARTEGSREAVVEMAVVGQPAQDGEDLVLDALQLVVAVTEPELSPIEQRAVLEELALTGPRPADPRSTVVRGETRYRTAADAERGIIGIGAKPASDPDPLAR